MSQQVDTGLVRTWPRVAHITWVVVMFVLMLAGVGFLSQVIRTATGQPEIEWFPSGGSTWMRTGIGPVLFAGGGALGLVAAGAIWWPDSLHRTALAAIGLFLVVLAVLHSRAVFGAPELSAWQELVGSTAVRLLYGLIGAAIMAVALLAD